MSTKNLIVILVIVLLAVAAWFMWSKPLTVTAPEGESVEIGANDTTPVITEELGSLELPDIDAELESVNEDLNLL